MFTRWMRDLLKDDSSKTHHKEKASFSRFFQRHFFEFWREKSGGTPLQQYSHGVQTTLGH